MRSRRDCFYRFTLKNVAVGQRMRLTLPVSLFHKPSFWFSQTLLVRPQVWGSKDKTKNWRMRRMKQEKRDRERSLKYDSGKRTNSIPEGDTYDDFVVVSLSGTCGCISTGSAVLIAPLRKLETGQKLTQYLSYTRSPPYSLNTGNPHWLSSSFLLFITRICNSSKPKHSNFIIKFYSSFI